MPVKNIKQSKDQIRNIAKKYRLNMEPSQKQNLDKILQENFIISDFYKDSELLLAFVSKKIEVSTELIIKTALNDGKRLALPRCKEENQMDFYYVEDTSQLIKGSYDLLEPDIEKCSIVSNFANSVCLVPGLVFDREGYRLGFGKGYYDRFLLEFNGITVGICYGKCIENKLPRGYYDRPVNAVITEKYTIDLRPN